MKKRNYSVLMAVLILVLASMACSTPGWSTRGNPSARATSEAYSATQEAIATEEPVEEPVEESTAEPTEEPVEEPTAEPTEEPAEEPTAEPTPVKISCDKPSEDIPGDPYDVTIVNTTEEDLTIYWINNMLQTEEIMTISAGESALLTEAYTGDTYCLVDSSGNNVAQVHVGEQISEVTVDGPGETELVPAP